MQCTTKIALGTLIEVAAPNGNIVQARPTIMVSARVSGVASPQSMIVWRSELEIVMVIRRHCRSQGTDLLRRLEPEDRPSRCPWLLRPRAWHTTKEWCFLPHTVHVVPCAGQSVRALCYRPLQHFAERDARVQLRGLIQWHLSLRHLE